MKRTQHHRYGGPEVLVPEECALSRPRTGEVLVRVMATTRPTAGPTALRALTRFRRLRPGQSIFNRGRLDGVDRAAGELALARGASVGGNGRASAHQKARKLGIDPVVDPDVHPAVLSANFHVAIDTADTLSPAIKRALGKPGGRIVGIHPTAAAFARAAVPEPFRVLVTRPSTSDPEHLGRTKGGKLVVTIAGATTP